jgi:hypothetical protein
MLSTYIPLVLGVGMPGTLPSLLPQPYVSLIVLYVIVVPCYSVVFRHSALCQISKGKKPNATSIKGNKLDNIFRYEETYIIFVTCVWSQTLGILIYVTRVTLTVNMTVRLTGYFSTQHELPYLGHYPEPPIFASSPISYPFLWFR